MIFRSYLLSFLLLISLAGSLCATEKIIIAENGGGNEFLEHTLVGITLTATKNVDFLELHVVMTADDQLIVFQDLTLNRLTDVATLFPQRSRDDGSYYAIDFSLREIRQLRLKQVFETSEVALSLGIPTLKEELSVIRKLESHLGKTIGIALEIKEPQFHILAGKDISMETITLLASYGYAAPESKLYIQCFSPEELQRIYQELLPPRQMTTPLIQLVGSDMAAETNSYSYEWLYTNSGLRMVANYASALGLPADKIMDNNGNVLLKEYITALHGYGLSILVKSLSSDPDQLPGFADTFQGLITHYFSKTEIDGFYTNSFISAQEILNHLEIEKSKKDALPEFFSSLDLSPSSITTTRANVTDKPSIKNDSYKENEANPNDVLFLKNEY